MPRRKRSFTAWLRIVHRWISMTFIVVAAVAILQLAPAGPITDVVVAVALVLLIALALSGIWMAAQHYIVKFRYARRPQPAPVVTS